MNRREILQIAAAWGVSCLLPPLGLRAAERRGPERMKSLITLWMAGGPSQRDTWDPRPGSRNGGPIQAIKTRIPDLEIAHLLPQSAEQVHHLSVIRSLVSKEGDHERGTYTLLTGYRPDPTVTHPSIGAIIASEAPNPGVEIPQHVSLLSGDSFLAPRGGYLGDQYDAFRVFDPGRTVSNINSRVDTLRQNRRLANLEVVSGAFRRGREQQVADTLHKHTLDQALVMMRSDQLRAFKIDDEPKQSVDRYGDSPFGRGCLVARRLVETGVRAVQVVLRGFDTHANNYEGHVTQTQSLDPALAALIQDLVARDLLESTIVLCVGEFGRTPRINPLDGRDHWPHGFSCVVGGGGLRGGQVIGATPADPGDEEKTTGIQDPITVPDLYATILQQLGITSEKEIITPIGRPLRLCEGSPLARLLPG